MSKPNSRTKNTGRGKIARALQEDFRHRTGHRDPYAITAPMDPEYPWQAERLRTLYYRPGEADDYRPLSAHDMEEEA